MTFQRIWLLVLVVGLIVIARRKALQGESTPATPPSVPSAAQAVRSA